VQNVPVAWSRLTSTDVAQRRASGRRRYNAERRGNAQVRQAIVYQRALSAHQETGWKSKAARELGVHPSTITRDYRAVMARVNRQETHEPRRLNETSQLLKRVSAARRMVPTDCDCGDQREEQPRHDLLHILDAVGAVDAAIGQGRPEVAEIADEWEAAIHLRDQLMGLVWNPQVADDS